MLYYRLYRYFLWFFVTVIFCLLPLGALVLIKSTFHVICSDVLIYNTTLLIVSLYLYLAYLRGTGKELISAATIIFGTIFALMVIWLFFAIYHLEIKPYWQLTDGNLRNIILSLLAISVFISLFLNVPLIEKSIQEYIAKKNSETMKMMEEKSKIMKNKLRGEENAGD